MSTSAPTPRRRRSLAALTVLVFALVLVGCGARIDTVLTVGSNGSGTRVMTLTLPADDVDELKGGLSAANSAITSALPAELDYSGLETGADGSLTTTFTLSFQSSAEYVEKAEALLDLADSSARVPLFTVTESPLVQGLAIDESYTSAALLQWLFSALIDDGVVGESTNRNDMYELGSTVLDYGGQRYTTQGGYVRAELVDDAGFSAVTMSTDATDIENIHRAITFVANPEQYTTRYEEYFAVATPAGAKLERTEGTWTLSFSGTSDQVEAATDVALSTNGTILDISISRSERDPASLTLTVDDFTSCAGVCSLDAPPLTDEVSTREEFSSEPLAIEPSGGEPVVLAFVPEFESTTQYLSFGLFGTVSATTTFTVANASADLVGDGFERLLAPDIGTMTNSVGPDSTTYNVTIEAPADQFDAAYSAWAPAGGLTIEHAPGSNLFGETTMYAFEPGLDSVTGAHPVLDPAPATVGLPFGKWVTAGASRASQVGGPLTLQAQGLTSAGLVAVGFAALLLVVGLVVLVALGRRLEGSRGVLLGSAFPPANRASPGGPSLLDLDYQHRSRASRPTLRTSSFPSVNCDCRRPGWSVSCQPSSPVTSRPSSPQESSAMSESQFTGATLPLPPIPPLFPTTTATQPAVPVYPFRLLRDERVLAAYPITDRRRLFGRIRSFLFITDSRVIYAAESKSIFSSSTELEERRLDKIEGIETRRRRGLTSVGAALAIGIVLNILGLIAINSVLNAAVTSATGFYDNSTGDSTATPAVAVPFGIITWVLVGLSAIVGVAVIISLARPVVYLGVFGVSTSRAFAESRDWVTIVVTAVLFFFLGVLALIFWLGARALGLFQASDAFLYANVKNIDTIAYDAGALILDAQTRGKRVGD